MYRANHAGCLSRDTDSHHDFWGDRFAARSGLGACKRAYYGGVSHRRVLDAACIWAGRATGALAGLLADGHTHGGCNGTVLAGAGQ